MGNPSNPSHGQQIIFQVTQGAAGPSSVTWGTGYEFSAGLPQPSLSTTAGQTDLLGFIYNAAKEQVASYRIRERIRLMTTYRLFPSTSGPSAPVSYSGPFMAGIVFQVTTGGSGLTATGGGCAHPDSPRRRRNSRSGRYPRSALVLYPGRDGHLRPADRRPVELRSAGHAGPAGHRRLL